MRQLVIVVLLLWAAGGAAGQGGRSYFGAPVAKLTSLRGQGALMAGGRGGLNLTRSLVLGAGLYGTVTGVNAREGAVPNAPGLLDVKLETFGLDVEYAPRPAAPTHLALGAFLGGGAQHYVRDGTSTQHGETDFMLVLEPSLGVEQRVTDRIHLQGALSYRLVRGVEQVGLKASDLRGPALSLALKLGRFGGQPAS